MAQARIGSHVTAGRFGGAPLAGWLTVALGLAAALALLLAGQAVAAAVPVPDLVTAIVVFYVAVFAPLAIVALALGRIERRSVLVAGQNPGYWAGLGLAAGVLGVVLCLALVGAFGKVEISATTPAVGMLMLGLAVTVLAVVAEELLFRGWLLPSLIERSGTWPAVALSALAFSLFHVIGGAAQPMSFVNLMLGGVWFALLALRSGGLFAPIAAHVGWNVAEDLGLGLIPNPGTGAFGALVDLDMLGGAAWGGSDEGLNASVAMTCVLIVLIVPLLRASTQEGNR